VHQDEEFRPGFWGTLRRLPSDLIAVVLLTFLANGVVFVPLLRGTPLQTVVGLGFVTVVPGYALVSALFPEADQSSFRRGTDPHAMVATDRRDISGVERAALSLGLSIAVVPLIGLALNFTPWGIQLVSIMGALSAFTLSVTAVAMGRRLALAPAERFQVWLFPYRSWLHRLEAPDTRFGALLNLTLVVAILFAAGTVGFALATPSPADATTEFYLLTENEDGELVTADYPDELVAGSPARLIVGIDNLEFEPVEYTVLVQLQEVERTDEDVSVLERRELARFEPSLATDETWRRSHEITPTMAGEDLRIQYLLYRGNPPEEPTAETAYRTLHLWVDVAPSDGDSTERLTGGPEAERGTEHPPPER